MIAPIVTWFIKQRINNVYNFMNNPHQVQEELFHSLIEQAANTEWGRNYDYKSINTPQDYCNRFPVQSYESVYPWIRRVMSGEQNILWNTPVRWFAKSSGTTADKSKFIPVSQEAIEECHYKGALDLLSVYCWSNDATRIFSGKGLIIGGSHQVNSFNNQVSYGDLSAVLLQNMSFFAQLYRTPDLTIALMDDWEKKIEQLAQTTIQENVTNISGVPTWTMILIKRLFEISGKDNLKEIWPELELYIHGGVSFTPYREQFKALIKSSEMHYYETYNASEGFFGFQFGKQDDDLLLHLNAGIFYEFIPFSEFGKEFPQTVMLDEVVTGEIYAPVISTNSGLWRYKVGDTIRFTSLKPYKFKVAGRVKHFINAFGEEVIAENADFAVTEACSKTGAVVKDYTVAPVYLSFENRGCHEWLIEFEKEPQKINVFVSELDKALRSVNTDYDAKRSKDIALSEPVVHSLPEKTFYNWMKSKGKLGGQHKVPRLSNDRFYVEEILSMLKATSEQP